MHRIGKTARLAAAAALSLAFVRPVFAVDQSRDDLLRLFNSRLAENPRRFAEAAKRVARGAEKDLMLNQFAIAVALDDPFFPAELKASIPQETVDRYRDNRSKIEYAAKNKGNAFAWYLLSLDAADEEDRMKCLGKAAAANNEQALNELGVLIVSNARTALSEAVENLRKAGESRAGAEEIAQLAKILDSRRRALASAQRQAAGYFRRAADKSDSNGCFNYGAALYYGYGVPRDQIRALEFLKQSAKDGHPQALSLLGECYRLGIGAPPDFPAALACFKRSAELGNASGQFNYGLAVLRGEGVEADPVAALPFLKTAAEKRLDRAMFEYASCLLDGAGFEERPEKGLAGEELDKTRAANEEARRNRQKEAAAWFYHAATDFLYAPAMERLAACLFEGLGVEKDARAAVYWYHRAAIGYGDVASMKRLAQCAEAGLGGVKKSHEDALWWLTRAKAAEGDRCARIWLGRHNPHKFDALYMMYGGAR